MRNLSLSFLLIATLSSALQAQDCDQSLQPDGLSASYTPGVGTLLQWIPLPGSQGVGIKVLPTSGGTALSKVLIGPELSQFLIPESALTPGVYLWRIWVACNATVPYRPTPISDVEDFEIPFAPSPNCGTVSDIDGNSYNTVVIGSQCWLSENLNVEHYRNGDAIRSGLSKSAWLNTDSGALASYDNDTANIGVYGLLYNWYAVEDERGLCPTGWHVPTTGDWEQLRIALGGTGVAGGKMKPAGTSATGSGLWQAPNTGASNSSGFSGLPGGLRRSGGSYFEQGRFANWWSSDARGLSNAEGRSINYIDTRLNIINSNRHFGFSVRCVQD